MNKSTLTTTALTVLRVIVGFIFAAHGWHELASHKPERKPAMGRIECIARAVPAILVREGLDYP